MKPSKVYPLLTLPCNKRTNRRSVKRAKAKMYNYEGKNVATLGEMLRR
jgi:hypothetical protein